MPRRKGLPVVTGKDVGPHVLHGNAVYSLEAARVALGLRRSSLTREIREGRLIASKRCGKIYLTGAQLLAWVETGTYARSRRAAG